MATFKCKMCGGDLKILAGMTVCECEYCGSKQTVPTIDNEKKLTLFSRANRLRLACEFDKASGIYENIVTEFPEEAEAYWGLVLCKFGIEYVDDPATGKKVPTCHRSSFEGVMDDSDFEQAIENADVVARRVYREEAKAIEELRKSILEVSGKEEPYDIFICYKETDESGQRTLDSVLAQDVYDALTEKGYRVFFSRISLEDKLGQEYEPYIFAALNSVKIMLAFGTDYEYFNAVWVKNEWSRFLKLMSKDKSKHLIPCYKDIDAYDMPKEFARLQAQDLGKVGAIQDLVRGIGKILGDSKPFQARQNYQVNNAALTQRGMIYLEDGEFDKAVEYFDRSLDENPTDSNAYLGKFLGNAGFRSISDLSGNVVADIENSNDFKRALQFADGKQSIVLQKLKADNELKIARLRVLDEIRKKAKIEAEKIAEKEKLDAIKKKKEYDRRKKEESITVLQEKRKRLKVVSGSISSGRVSGYKQLCVLGLKSDGTVKVVGDNLGRVVDVVSWRNVVAISAGVLLAVGLKSDGTVVTAGGNCLRNVSSWKNIVAVSACEHVVGLKSDGTVVAAGKMQHGEGDVSAWRNIVAISAGDGFTVGLKSDGTVVIAGKTFPGVSAWRDIVAVSAVPDHAVGLKSDGTVVVSGGLLNGAWRVSSWRNIVAISAGDEFSVGLKLDGTVVTAGNIKGAVSSWSDIVAISAAADHVVGLKSDGTVVTTKESLRSAMGWKLFKSLDTLEEERRVAFDKEEQERQKKIQQLKTEKETLRTELSKLKGPFNGKRRKEIEKRLEQITTELWSYIKF